MLLSPFFHSKYFYYGFLNLFFEFIDWRIPIPLFLRYDLTSFILIAFPCEHISLVITNLFDTKHTTCMFKANNNKIIELCSLLKHNERRNFVYSRNTPSLLHFHSSKVPCPLNPHPIFGGDWKLVEFFRFFLFLFFSRLPQTFSHSSLEKNIK